MAGFGTVFREVVEQKPLSERMFSARTTVTDVGIFDKNGAGEASLVVANRRVPRVAVAGKEFLGAVSANGTASRL